MKAARNNYISALLFVILFFTTYIFFSGTIPNKNNLENEVYIKPIAIPEKLDFCGEAVPLEDEEVRERVDKELLGNAFWQSSNLMHLKKMVRFFPIIEASLKRNGMPDDLKFLAVAESGLSSVVSPVGAAGYWQFMPATGKQYGLEINDEIDERYHIDKSTEAACRYLRDMNEIFNSWTLSAAAYNCGVGGVQKSLAFQKVSNYYDLFLNTETSRYIFRIIALKEILSNPEKYHYQFSKNQGYQPYKTIKINVSGPVLNWADWAINRGVNYKTLRNYNPWIKKHTLTNKLGKTYIVELPVDKKNMHIDEQYTNKLESIAEDTTSKLHKLEENDAFKVYEVKAGENIYSVSEKLNVKIADLMHWNELKSKTLKKGQKLKYINDLGD